MWSWYDRRRRERSTPTIDVFDTVRIAGRPGDYLVVSFMYPDHPFTDGPIVVRLLPRETEE